MKAPLANPSFTGTITGESIKVNNIFTDSPIGFMLAGGVNILGSLTVNGSATITSDATVNGNLYVTDTDKCITTRAIQAPPSNNLTLRGIVNVGQYLNSPGATLATPRSPDP